MVHTCKYDSFLYLCMQVLTRLIIEFFRFSLLPEEEFPEQAEVLNSSVKPCLVSSVVNVSNLTTVC